VAFRDKGVIPASSDRSLRISGAGIYSAGCNRAGFSPVVKTRFDGAAFSLKHPGEQRNSLKNLAEGKWSADPSREESVLKTLCEKGILTSIPRTWLDSLEIHDDLAHVRELFAKQAPGVPVYEVYRVENPGLGVVYGAVRDTMAIKVERILWHGTSMDSVRNIAFNGFNRAYCGRHGLKYGHGSYFSSSAEYSIRFCDRQGSRRMMFLAKVLVGESTRGSPEMLEPPYRDAELAVRYDSTVDNISSPNIFCIFRDFQALPLYLVEFGMPSGVPS
jgi:poly [ADP-ribose] polymerase 10/14/15